MKTTRKQKKRRPPDVGRRTGVSITQGKKIRAQDDGIDNYEDYWTQSERSIGSVETNQSERISGEGTSELISENSPIRDSDVKFQKVSTIGRRTGVNIVEGKTIRVQDDGIEVFEDYWTDSESSVQTHQSVLTPDKTRRLRISENVSVLNGDAESFQIVPMSSLKKTALRRNEEYIDNSQDVSSEQSDDTRKKQSQFSENKANPNVTRSVLTQTSFASSKNRTSMHEKSYLKEIQNEELFDIEIDSSARGSSRVLSNISIASNRSEALSVSKSNTNAANVSLAQKRKSRENFENRRHSLREKSCDMTRSSTPIEETKNSPTKNKASASKPSYLEETEKNRLYSSPRKSPRVISSSSPAPDLNEEASISNQRSAVKGSSTQSIKSRENTDDRRNSIVRKSPDMTRTSRLIDESESSPTNNKTYTEKHSYSEETGKNGHDSSDRKIDSFLRKPPNKSKGLSLSKDYTNAENNSLSHKLKSKEKVEDKRNSVAERSRDMAQSSLLLRESEKYHLDTSGRKINSSLKRSSILSDVSPAPNRNKGLSSSRNNANTEMDTLSHNMKFRERIENKRNSVTENSRFRTRSSILFDETKSTPSKNNAYKLKLSYLKETEKYNDDSSDSERSASEERSAIVSSKNLTSPNRKKESYKMNKSEQRSGHTAESFEALNQEESIPSKSVNWSEIPISDRKDNERGGGKRRSSVSKLVAVRRKSKQSSDSLEKRLPNTSLIQNSVEKDGNSTSRRGYFQHAVESIDMLNQKEIPSGSDEIVNEAENSAYSEDEQMSLEKSHISKKKIKQIPEVLEKASNRADSPLKAVSPVHSVRRKIAFTEATKDAQQEKESEPLRRSSRMRVKPLASWRNERLKFELSASGELNCVGVDEGRPEDDYGIKFIKKRMEYQRNRISKKPKSSSKKPWKNRISKTKITNYKTGVTRKVHLHRYYSTYEWIDVKGISGLRAAKVFCSDMITFGFLEMDAHCMKDRQVSPADNIHFNVIKGTVDVAIDTTIFTFCRGDSFVVPFGTFYSINNKSDSKALVSFTSFKVAFYKYQK